MIGRAWRSVSEAATACGRASGLMKGDFETLMARRTVCEKSAAVVYGPAAVGREAVSVLSQREKRRDQKSVPRTLAGI